MRQFYIENDTILDSGYEVDYLGHHYDKIKSGEVKTLPADYDGWFPFMPMCYSIGDLGIRSGIFEALKVKYPKIKIAFPKIETIATISKTNLWVDHLFNNSYNINEKINSISNYNSVMKNNPHIDYYFEVGDFNVIFSDHDRSYTSLKEINGTICSTEEPLAEQILRRFGFSDDDVKNIDSKPKLYFTDEEIENGNSIIKKHTGKDYGCLLFSGRLEKFNKRWEIDYLLYEDAKIFKNTPVFFFSSFDLTNTEWDDFFPKRFDFSELDLSIREQMYIKSKAKFNLGYMAGITDSTSGSDSSIINLCPYETIRENVIRGSKYIFSDRVEQY